MLKTYWSVISWLERVADNAIIIVAFAVSYAVRDLALGESAKALGPIRDYFVVLGFTLPLFNATLSILGAYRSMRLTSPWRLLRQCLFSAVIVFLAITSLLFVLKLDLSRSFVGMFCLISGCLLFVERQATLLFLRFFRVRGQNFRNVLLVGSGEPAKKISAEILKQPELGIRVVGFFPFDEKSTEFEQRLKRNAVDEVIFTETARYYAVVEELAQVAYEEGVSVSLVADLFSLDILKSDLSYFGNFPLLHYRRTHSDSPAFLVKRLIDIVLSGTLLTLLAPVLMLIGIAVKLESAGPVFFRQRRVGLNGRTFVLLKFRSMIDGAEEMLAELQGRNEMNGPVFKIKNDPRLTRLGTFLRRYSLDELPQLFNVLRGDMSLVGPRPPLPEEVSRYERRQRRRLSMRPGLTCIWQVSGRNNIPDFDHWAKLDLEYIDNWSLKQDFHLLLKTIPAVLSGFGAR